MTAFFQLADLQTPLYRIAIYAVAIVCAVIALAAFSFLCEWAVGRIGPMRRIRVRWSIRQELRSEADRGRLTIAARVPR